MRHLLNRTLHPRLWKCPKCMLSGVSTVHDPNGPPLGQRQSRRLLLRHASGLSFLATPDASLRGPARAAGDPRGVSPPRCVPTSVFPVLSLFTQHPNAGSSSPLYPSHPFTLFFCPPTPPLPHKQKINPRSVVVPQL